MDVRTKRTFKTIFITLLIDLLAFTLILPLLPKILDYYATYDQSGVYRLFDDSVEVLRQLLNVPKSHNQVLLAGILGSWFSVLQFISSPFVGALSDHYGRRRVLLSAVAGSTISYITWFLSSHSFAIFILSRTIGGLSKANVGLSLAVISDVSNEKTRGKGMALVGSSFSLAFILGPLLGAYLSTLARGDQLHNQLIVIPSIIASALSIIDLIIIFKYLEETTIHNKINQKGRSKWTKTRKQSAITKAFHYVNPKSLFKFSLVQDASPDEYSTLQKSGTIYFYYLLFYSGLEFTLSFLTHMKFGFTSMDQGKLYLYSGIFMATIQGGYIRRMKPGREASIAMIGLSLIIPSFIIMGLSTSVSQVYMALTLYSFSSAVVVPCLTTIVSSHSPLKSRGAVMGTFRSIGSLARAIGPFFASFLFWTLGPALCYIGGAILLLFPWYKMTILKKALNKTSESEPTVRKRKVAFQEIPAKAS